MNRARPLPEYRVRAVLGVPSHQIPEKSPVCKKRAHPTYESALHALLSMAKKTGAPWRIDSRCKTCGGFHITRERTTR